MIKSLLIFLLFTYFIGISYSPIQLIDKRQSLLVDVQGEINNPGIFELPNGSTINDLFKLLNFKEDADVSSINGFIELNNEDKLLIPVKTEIRLISINTATIEQLNELPGIGNSTALKIIEYRDTIGLFQSIDELKNVKGIGDAKFNKLKNLISL